MRVLGDFFERYRKMPDWMINYWPFLGILLILGIIFLIKGTGAFGLEKDDDFVIAGGVLTGVGALGVYPAIHELRESVADRGMFTGSPGLSNSVRIVELPNPITAMSLGGSDPRIEEWTPTKVVPQGILVNRKSRKSRKSRKNRKTVA